MTSTLADDLRVFNEMERKAYLCDDLMLALKEIARCAGDNVRLLPESKSGVYAYILDVARTAILGAEEA